MTRFKNPLHIACEQGDLVKVTVLVNEEKKDPNALDEYETPLQVACKNGRYEIARFFLCNPNVDPRLVVKYSSGFEHNILQSRGEDIRILELLFAYGLDPYTNKWDVSIQGKEESALFKRMLDDRENTIKTLRKKHQIY